MLTLNFDLQNFQIQAKFIATYSFIYSFLPVLQLFHSLAIAIYSFYYYSAFHAIILKSGSQMPRASSSTSQLRSNSHQKGQKQPNSSKFLGESKLKPTTLSSQIDFSVLKDVDKISAVYRSITILDCIHQSNVISTHLIKTLYLSNNFISDIEHIQQFPNLESLSLGFNQICEIPCLRYLSFLPKLTTLSLQGNPIAKHPLYEVYVMGVTANCHQLKTMDGKNILAKKRDEGIKHWDLLTNYLKMVNLMQFNKRQAVNYVIKKAACNIRSQIHKFQITFSQESKIQEEEYVGSDSSVIQQKTRLNKCVDLCLKQTELELQYLPNKYVMKLENTLDKDVMKLSNKRLEQLRNKQVLQQNNSLSVNLMSERPMKNASLNLVSKLRITDKGKIANQVEIFISSMYQLLQRQKQRIEEICYKIHNLYDSLFGQGYQNISKVYRDIEKVEEILEKVFRFIQKEQLYYQWKIINRCFQKLKYDTKQKIDKRQGINKINRILSLQIPPKMKQALGSIQMCSNIYLIKQVVHILCRASQRYESQIYQICFRTLKDRAKCQRIMQNSKSRPGGIQRVRKIEKTHHEQDHMLRINFDNEFVSLKLKSQLSYLNKNTQSTRWQSKKIVIKCWNQWVKMHRWLKLEEENRNLKQKLKQSQVREGKLLNKICLLQQIHQLIQYKQKKPAEKDNQLKQLIIQIQRDCSTLKDKVKKQSLSSPPSVKRNCRNISPQGSQKQNGVEHGAIEINNRQRKFNCSRRNLKICHQNFDTN